MDDWLDSWTKPKSLPKTARAALAWATRHEPKQTEIPSKDQPWRFTGSFNGLQYRDGYPIVPACKPRRLKSSLQGEPRARIRARPIAETMRVLRGVNRVTETDP